MNLFSKINILRPVLKKITGMLTRRQKFFLTVLTIATVGFSLVETVGISVIMPFISLASDPKLLFSGWYNKIYNLFTFSTPESFIIAFGIAIIIFYLFRAVYSLLLTWFMNIFSAGMYKYLSKKIFKTVLSVPYKVYALKNSGELIHSIYTESMDVNKIILHILKFNSEIFTVIMVYAVIVILNWKMTLIVTITLIIIVYILLSIITNINKTQGQKRLLSGRKLNRTLKETLGNFKFVKLKGNEEKILQEYSDDIEVHGRSEVYNNLLEIMPKSILESIGFSLLVAAVVVIIRVYHDASSVIPIISMYALALYRILPSIHRMLQDINVVAYLQKTLDSVDECLNQKTEDEGSLPISFNKSIRLENIQFSHITGSIILNGISLEIKKGDKIAITGESGSGKSTLVDLITGIHKPVSGKVFIDDTDLNDDNIKSWRKIIGYIPQNIYLFDGTVAQNVSFGSVSSDEKIIKALQMANIWDFLTTKDGINTIVGEGGIQLSGGQQQRIGIARALYEDPEILVLDEATSALDTETEKKIMDEIYSLSKTKTLIVIAHRLSTVERCERKITIENGKITC
jgi:ATP-binding cassette subfamily B protein/ATP-binding cassette subfamily C protein